MPDALDRNFARSQAILIGSWDYTDLDPVPAARHSLERMADLLTGPLCGWPSERVHVVGNQRRPGDLSDVLVEKFEQTSDIALFYFVGHGQYDPDGRLCLALCDTSSRGSRRTTTSVTYDQVQHAFRASRAPTKIVILDCCFAGLAATNSLSGKVTLPPAHGSYLMMATGAYTTAWFQGEDESHRPQTFFTKALIDAVERGDPEAGPGITLDDMFHGAADLLARDGNPRPEHQRAGYANGFLFARNLGHSGTSAPRPTPETEAPELPVPAPLMAMPPDTTAGQEPVPLMKPGVRRKLRLSAVRWEHTEAGVRNKAAELGIQLGKFDAPGVRVGRSVPGGETLYGSYGDSHLDIWGPRRGKTSSRVAPAILEAIGPVLVTSTKRDVVDLTREVREAKGSPTFVFDPDGLADEDPTWCWDPLAWIDSRHEGAELRAAKLVAHFADSADGVDASSDASVAVDAEDLLANLFLAAAVGHRSIISVLDWLGNPHDYEPIELLRNEGGFAAADALSSHYNGDPGVRDRVSAVAVRMTRSLRHPGLQRWITPSHERAMFDELEFIERNCTLYALASPGRGSAAPLISALAGAVLDVAFRKAVRCVGSRLPIPMLAVFEDAPDLLRWRDLTRVYAAAGSRGVVAMLLLQSWGHGVKAWGADGMADIWASATLRVIGGGLAEIDFARPYFEAMGYPATPGSGAPNSSRLWLRGLFGGATRRTRPAPFSVADLLTLPVGEAVVLPSHGAPVLVRTVPWWDTDYAADVRKALAHPKGIHRRTNIADLIGPIEEVKPL